MLATPGLRNGTSPSCSTMQVKCLWVHAPCPKLDASTQPSRRLYQDRILRWASQWRKNLKWHGHGSVTETY